jgi:uncharacterized protein YprB with RNaseH-like and TPR domain
MSVISRLQRLTGESPKVPGGENGGQARTEELSRLRERIDAVLSRRPEGLHTETPPAGRGRGVPLEELVPGEETTNEAGAFFCACHLAGGSARHGRFCIRDLTPLDMGRLAVLGNNPALRGLDYREALFLDTETTGLAGGTGTVAFLIGLGWFEGDAFVTRQLFARDYAEERATLLALRELLGGKRFLVSFNGKAFDANLLAARFIMNRLPDPLACLPHLDLLHPARRLLSHRLADRRLGALEIAILGFEREGDIPGSEIPQRYFDWLRRRDGRLMADVFEHNRLDILSLAALAAHLAELIDPDGENARCHPGDRLAAARLFLARDCPGEAVRLLDPLVGCTSPETARDAARELSIHYRRAGQWPAAVAIWEEMLRRDGEDLFALVELAKWCEHRRRDFARALALTERAGSGRLSPDERAGLVRRRERLERKLASPR